MRGTATLATQQPSRRKGWGAGGKSAMWPLAALAATTMLAQGDQSSLGQAVTGIEHQFHASDQLVGLIPFLMAVAGGIGAIPIGVVADRHRRTWLLAAVCALWALLMGVGALAVGIVMLFVARLAVGATEGTPPVAISLVSDYVPVRRRSEAMGVYQAGAIFGAFIGLIGGGVAVQIGGWMWAFLIWVPIGIVVAVGYVFLHEPTRGSQDATFEATIGPSAAVGGPEAMTVAASGHLSLPEPRRDTTPDVASGQLTALRALLRIPTMWFGTWFFTVSQLLLSGLSFWGVVYFERVHHLKPAAAGTLAALLGVGSAIGVISGGTVADRLLRRGHVNARVYVAALGSIGATLVLAPAFASSTLAVTAPLLFVGGILLTVPVAPGEALCTDVVPPELRGRGAMVRQLVRTASFTGPYLIGVISDQIAPNTALGLRWAIVAACPLYALGGLIMLAAARTYPRDIATVIAHCRRIGTPAADPGSADAGSHDPGSGDPGSGDPGSHDPGSQDPDSQDPDSQAGSGEGRTLTTETDLASAAGSDT
jgi:MFS family permease